MIPNAPSGCQGCRGSPCAKPLPETAAISLQPVSHVHREHCITSHCSYSKCAMEPVQIVGYAQKSLDFTAYDVHWVPSSARVVTLGTRPRGTGSLNVYELNGGQISSVKEVEKRSGFKCGTFSASHSDTRHLATGSFDGQLEIWDLESLSNPVYSVKAHSEIVNCIDGVGGEVGKGSPEIVTGSRDGSVKVWDPRQKDKPVVNVEPSEGEARRDCWAVAFGNAHHSDNRRIGACYDNGDVKVFDLRTMSVLWEDNVKNGACSLEFDRKDIPMNKLVVTTLEAKLHVYDMRCFHPKKGYASLTQKAHSSTIWTVRHLPQNRDVFITSGGNGSLQLWKYTYPDQREQKSSDGQPEGVPGSLKAVQSLTLSAMPISSFDWSRDKTGLGVCTSFDQSLRVVVVTRLETL